MLPRTAQLLAIFSVLMEMTATSPVYNMQPAYITATIGSTGRNIRNLPCISRKSNQSGVCMFAIDCLKANGTHLGTCIDRFYFGSCCHIAPLEEITENTIDAALIPSREPPHRITTQTPTPTPTRTTTTSTTASTTTTTTSKPLVKEGLVITTTNPLQPNQDDPESYKITTFQTIDDVPVATTIRPRPTPSKVKSTPKPVQTRPTTTTKVTKAPQRPQTTPKPITTINRNTTQLVNATRPQTTTPRPRPKPTKPIRITKPQNSTLFINGTTPTPNVQKTTKVPTTRAPKPTKKPVVTKITLGTTSSIPTPTTATTKKPITTKVPVSVTTSKITTKPSTSTTAPITTTTATATTTRTTTLSNEVLVAVNASNLEDTPNVNGNPVTNEIEAPKPLSTVDKETTTAVPSLVTWSEINKNESNSDKSTTTSTTTTTTTTSKTSPTTEKVTIPPLIQNPDDWVPLTDNWVQLPSITTAQPENPDLPTILTTTTSTENSVSVSSSEANQPETRPSSMEILTTLSLSSSSSASFSTESLPVSISSTEDASLSSSSVSTEEVPLPTVDGQTTAAPATSGLNMSDFTDVCGRRMVPEGRIVGGEKSAFGKWPWQISLRQWRTSTYLHKCGAALLNENWAITAAHCVDNVPPSDLLLRLGEHDLSTEAEPYLHQERRVQIVASHPQFDPRTFEYDLALLRFYEPVTFQPNIIPVCVPQTDENFVGRNAHVTGWGRLYEDGPLPSVLQEVSVPVINNTVCESMYRSAGYIEHIPNIFICAGWRRGGFDSCEGDSGGPMVIQRQADKRFVLAGVISWGIGCAEPNQPGVYTRISEFRDWINQILQF